MIAPGTVVRLNSAKGVIERVVTKDHGGDHVTVARAEEVEAAKLEGRAPRASTFPKSALVTP